MRNLLPLLVDLARRLEVFGYDGGDGETACGSNLIRPSCLCWTRLSDLQPSHSGATAVRSRGDSRGETHPSQPVQHRRHHHLAGYHRRAELETREGRGETGHLVGRQGRPPCPISLCARRCVMKGFRAEIVIIAILSLSSCDATRASPYAGQPDGIVEQHYMPFAPSRPMPRRASCRISLGQRISAKSRTALQLPRIVLLAHSRRSGARRHR